MGLSRYGNAVFEGFDKGDRPRGGGLEEDFNDCEDERE